MATFEAKDGKRVRTPKGIVNFKGGILETDDKEVIEALRKALDVTESDGADNDDSSENSKLTKAQIIEVLKAKEAEFDESMKKADLLKILDGLEEE